MYFDIVKHINNFDVEIVQPLLSGSSILSIDFFALELYLMIVETCNKEWFLNFYSLYQDIFIKWYGPMDIKFLKKRLCHVDMSDCYKENIDVILDILKLTEHFNILHIRNNFRSIYDLR